MNIYVDLDGTLIHATSRANRPPFCRSKIKMSGGEVYYSTLRPCAHSMLAALRSMGSVRLLTTSVAEYALSHNHVFSLGFADGEIIARENYIKTGEVPFGTAWVTFQTGTDPRSILIDDLPHSTESSRIKMDFLGIPLSYYIQIPAFIGEDQPNSEQECETILAEVHQAMYCGNTLAESHQNTVIS